MGDFSAQMRYTFNDYIARELTHDVVEDDGWFQTTRTVSDGLAWNRPALTAVSMEVYVGAVRVPAEKIVEAINKKLRNDGWKERTDGSGMLTSKLKNRNCTVYTHSYPPDNIRISISFD